MSKSLIQKICIKSYYFLLKIFPQQLSWVVALGILKHQMSSTMYNCTCCCCMMSQWQLLLYTVNPHWQCSSDNHKSVFPTFNLRFIGRPSANARHDLKPIITWRVVLSQELRNLSILIALFSKSSDISRIDMAYRYIKHFNRLHCIALKMSTNKSVV